MVLQATPQTVLLVEDEPAFRQLMRHMLEGQGYTMLAPRNCADALQVAESHPTPIHLLLTEIVMPSMDGFELATRVTSMHPETRVLFMTEHGVDRPEVAQSLQRTPHAFLVKPFTSNELKARVQVLFALEGLDLWHPPAAPRVISAIPVLYRPAGQPEWQGGLTVNISESGILMDAVSALAPESRLDLTFEMFKAIGRLGSGTVSRCGRVVRHATPTPSIPHPLGIQFLSA